MGWQARHLAIHRQQAADLAERVRQGYSVVADRLETIGLVYLWPEGN